MKKNFVLVLLLFISVPCFALHIAGGELYYKYVGPGATANTDRYTITLRLFRECHPVVPAGQAAAPMPSEVELGIFTNNNELGSGTVYKTLFVPRTKDDFLSLQSPLVCIVNPPEICYEIGYFTTTMDLPQTDYGYTIAYQTCCRSFIILNVQFFDLPGPPNNRGEGATYTCVIPGTKTLGKEHNNSAVFDVKDTVLVCENKKIRLDFSASDADHNNPSYADSLSYSFCNAYNRGDALNSSDIAPSNPPYQSVVYTGGYSGASPMGTDVAIDPQTGIISGTIGGAGGYVVTVCVAEWRHGKIIGIHRKDFLLRVTACDFAAADLKPSYITCNGYALDFKNESTSSAIKSYFWDFGDPNNPAKDTSIQPTPTYTYTDTGEYTVKLVINKGQQCTDSATTIAKVYPGFVPDFSVKGSCLQTPYYFTDLSTTRYGEIDSWTWKFGDGTGSDTTNPVHSYTSAGLKAVTLTVTNTKGCIEDLEKQVDIRDRPAIYLPFRDTLICNQDVLQLSATADFPGIFTWSPNTNITSVNSPRPKVNPTDTITYYVSFSDGKGCDNTDSVKINVVDSAFVHLGRDTVICLTDTIQLIPQTNALYFNWQPALYIDSPQAKMPFVAPLATTTYTVTAKVSDRCIAKDDITIQEIPYPQANAGPDVVICYNKSVKLSATIKGSTFAWSPANSLYNANTLTPTAGPQSTTTYTLTVYDTLTRPNCPKPMVDYVTVKVSPKVIAFAGNDTSVVIGQPVQFTATGGISYTWQPATGLNDPNIFNPIGTYQAGTTSVTYQVRVLDSNGCAGYDDVTVKIFQTAPEIFVPTAFSPNGDNTNDILYITVAGLKQFDYFRIYNRWGNMVYSTTNPSLGWDGTFGGYKQPPGTYVFAAHGTDYLDKPVFRKGTLVLIR